MTRRTRIGLELFGPGLIAGILLNLAWGGVTGWKIIMEGMVWEFEPQILTSAGMLILAAYWFAGLQSFLYMAIMEWCFAHGLDPESWRAVRLSTGLGFLSAMIPYGVILFDMKSGEQITTSVVLGGFGLAVGFLLGLLIKLWSAEKENAGGINP